MSSEEIRKSFLEFFSTRGHVVVSSSSLVPSDSSVLLTTAGMQQFKKYYTGELDAMQDFGSRRTTSVQKCFRTSDIEEVGDNTHLTFFEMLGNFSFGPLGKDSFVDYGTDGYFKRASLHWGYQYIVEVLGVSPERITVSVFKGDNEVSFDEESYNIWHKEIGLSERKIIKGSREDNFWELKGEEGPCGPCSEIYVDGIEIWNHVFNEYYKKKDGTYLKLANPGVDTGMGLERLLTILNGARNVFETDLFLPIFSKLKELAPNLDESVLKIFADHLRASAFLIADGLRPSNKDAGYILRRLLRRILAYRWKYDIHADLFPEIVEVVKDKFGNFYPELKNTQEIINVMEEESQKFQTMIGRGIKELEKYEFIGGKEAFYLYETFGLPFELIKELAPAQSVRNLKKEDFDQEFMKHQELSRSGAEKKFGGHGLILNTGELKASNEEEIKKVTRLHTATHLLNWALRQVLGLDVKQMGSDITAARSRFDFSASRKLTFEEIKQIEEMINEQIRADLPVSFKEMPKAEAEKIAIAAFKHKYPDVVKVYYIGNSFENAVSREFCGGPHVNRTSEIGRVRIIKEEGVAAGIRRIRFILDQ
jgi:alanyl-tRNA synthetase